MKRETLQLMSHTYKVPDIEKTRNPYHSRTLKDSQTHCVRLVLHQHQCDGQVELAPEKQGWFNSWELINATIPY